MKPLPIFTWEAPNICPTEGAVWVASPTPTPWTAAEKGFARGDYKQKSRLYKAPGNVGTSFYKTLRALGYTRGLSGNYA